jgi:hypothetical protein
VADRPMVSAAALTAFNAYLPTGLNEKQLERVFEAATQLTQQVWAEATSAHVALTSIRNDFRHEERARNLKTALAEAFDTGWEAHRLEALAQEEDPEHAIRRENPWREEAPAQDGPDYRCGAAQAVPQSKDSAVELGIEVVCRTCNEVLGTAITEGGRSARWWADKLLFEHQDERHD